MRTHRKVASIAMLGGCEQPHQARAANRLPCGRSHYP